jgi:DNA-binding HxlR family transcriptional regulator
MQDHDTPDTRVAERAVILQLLSDEHDERWTLAELTRRITDVPARAIRSALTRLELEGVAVRLNGQVLASRCVRHLDALELVSI